MKITIAHLKTGDYSTLEYPDVVVERKSLADYWGCLTTSRRRFEDELWRLSSFAYPLVVLECDWRNLTEPLMYNAGGGHYKRSRVPPLVAQNSLLSWMQKYRVPILPCGNRKMAAKVVLQHFDMAVHNWKEQHEKKWGPEDMADAKATDGI